MAVAVLIGAIVPITPIIIAVKNKSNMTKISTRETTTTTTTITAAAMPVTTAEPG